MSLLKNNENRSVVIFTLAAFDWWSFLHSRERRSGHFRARATNMIMELHQRENAKIINEVNYVEDDFYDKEI